MTTIGFTGTRNGMSESQKTQVKQLLTEYLKTYKNLTVIHGDCIGADEDFHNICSELSSSIKIVIYPGHPKNNVNNIYRAHCKSNNIREPKEFLERNRDIVSECNFLIACPQSEKEELRSGTWFTIRHAQKVGKEVKIVV